MIQRELRERLAGGFEVIVLPHWSLAALLRRLFHLACAYSGQVFSYQKMLG